MSEHQYYEFQAIDRPLTDREMSTLRNYSSRATITSTRFVNRYTYGSFKGNASEWMDKYFDAFLSLANWGTHELMLRLPRGALDLETAQRYLLGDVASARTKGDTVILSFLSEQEGGDWMENDEGSGWMSSVIPVRADLTSGDFRVLYLGWLLCAQAQVLDEDGLEPPVPAGLDRLSAPIRAFADFLRIGDDLITVAAERSSPAASNGNSRKELERWVGALPDSEKTGGRHFGSGAPEASQQLGPKSRAPCRSSCRRQSVVRRSAVGRRPTAPRVRRPAVNERRRLPGSTTSTIWRSGSRRCGRRSTR